MSTFEEKFKNLNFNDKDRDLEKKFKELDKLEELEKLKNKNQNSNTEEKTSFDNEKNAAQTIFKELVKNIAKNTRQDKMFILFLIAMLKSKNASNELILALLYIFI